MKLSLSLRTLGVVGWALLGCLGLTRIARADAAMANGNSSGSRATQTTIDDVATSHEHFNRGVDYVHDGDLKGALIEFRRAYAVSPNYRVLFNLGQVANALGRYTEAQEYFQRYLNDGQDDITADRRRDVEAQLGKLAGRIATLVLTSNVAGAEIFVDDQLVGTSPLQGPVKVSSGTRTLAAISSGRPRVSQVIDVAGGDTVAVQLSFPQPNEVAATPNTLSAPIHPSQPNAPEAHSGNPALWLGITSGALLVGAGVMGYLTVRDANKYDDAVARKTTVRELDDLDSRATTKALVTDVLLGATVVAAGITVLLALSGNAKDEREKPAAASRKAKPTPANTQVSLGVGSLQLRGAF